MDLASAGPLVLETLADACSQNEAVLKPAEKRLQGWEHQPGFYTILSVSGESITCNNIIYVFRNAWSDYHVEGTEVQHAEIEV